MTDMLYRDWLLTLTQPTCKHSTVLGGDVDVVVVVVVVVVTMKHSCVSIQCSIVICESFRAT